MTSDDRQPRDTESLARSNGAPARRPYRAPILRELGSVRELTLGISGAANEPFGNNMMA